MVSTAHEQFKALRMWPEAVECLIVAERKVEAEDMVKDRKSWFVIVCPLRRSTTLLRGIPLKSNLKGTTDLVASSLESTQS